MFVFMHYNGGEPGWASSLLEAGLTAYSPARPFSAQISSLERELEEIKPNAVAYKYSDAFKLSENLWKPLSQVKQVLLGADSLVSTEHCIWRDQWLLSRADLLLVESGASLEIPVLAYLWDIKTIAISFSPAGNNPWLLKSAHLTINNPENVEDILEILGQKTSQKTLENVEE